MVNFFDKWLLYFLLPLCWTGSSLMLAKNDAAHPFYVSVTEINHNAGEKTLEISCKMFAEDVEEVAKNTFKTPIDLSSTAAQEQAAIFMHKYMQQHLQLQADGKPVALKFIGFEKESEAVYCYLEGSGVQAVKKLSLHNSILQDFTADQINIIHVTVAGNRKSTKLNYPHKSATFDF